MVIKAFHQCDIMNLKAFLDVDRKILAWFFAVMASVLAWFLISPPSLTGHLAVFIWLLTGLIVLYLARKKDFGKKLVDSEKYLFTGAGAFIIILSFFYIQIGLGNPPYSIDDFSVLLSGITIIFFTYMGRRRTLLTSAIPFIAIVAFQVYDKIRFDLEGTFSFLIPPVVYLSISVLRLLGVNAYAEETRIMFNTVQGQPMGVPIVFDCSGVESMSTFLLAAAVVFYFFREMPRNKKLAFLAVGIAGTYAANIMRVVIICLSGYYYGPEGAIELVHIHTGWILFAVWMFIFWYAFFLSYMRGQRKGQKKKGIKATEEKTKNKIIKRKNPGANKRSSNR